MSSQPFELGVGSYFGATSGFVMTPETITSLRAIDSAMVCYVCAGRASCAAEQEGCNAGSMAYKIAKHAAELTRGHRVRSIETIALVKARF